jgi:hypothetical protein
MPQNLDTTVEHMNYYYASDEAGWVVVLAKNAKNARKNVWKKFWLWPTIVTKASKKEIADYRASLTNNDCPF